MEISNSDKEQKIIDMVCEIPLEQWDDKSVDKVLQTSLKGKYVRLKEQSNGQIYTLDIGGIKFDSKKLTELFVKVSNYVSFQKNKELMDKRNDGINKLYNMLANENN